VVVEDDPPVPVVNAPKDELRLFLVEVRAVADGIPDRLRTRGDLVKAEAIAVKIDELRKASWQGVDELKQEAELASVAAKLERRMAGLVEVLRKSAVEKFASGESGDTDLRRLDRLSEAAPTALALVAGQHEAALRSVKAAVLAANPLASLAPAERRAIEVLRSGRESFTPGAGATFDVAGFNNLLDAAGRVREGVDIAGLVASKRAASDFLAAVGEAWTEATSASGAFRDHLRDDTWRIVHETLSRQAGEILGDTSMLRTPARRASTCREYLLLLFRVQAITQRVAVCAEGDELRTQVGRFFEEPLGRRSLVQAWTSADAAREGGVPWIGALFRDARAAENDAD